MAEGCKKEKGCTNVQAANFRAEAEEDDGSCMYYLLAWTAEAHDPIEIYIDSVFQDSLKNHRLDTVVTCLESNNLFKKSLKSITFYKICDK